MIAKDRLGRGWLFAIAATLAAGTAHAAQAQDRVILGLGVANSPEYDGSDTSKTGVVPLVDISKGRFFANMSDGLGVTAFEAGDFRLGAGLVYLSGFDRPASLASVSGSAGARLFAAWERDGFGARIGVTQIVSGDLDGMTADANLSYRYIVTPRFSLIPSIGATWANEKFNQSYFGISPAEAAQAGIATYAADAGVNKVSIGLTATYRLTERVNLTASARASRLQGDARDSPLVTNKMQRSIFLGLSYRF